MRLRRFLTLGTAFALLLAVLIIDLIRRNVGLEVGGLSIVRGLMVLIAFAQITFFLRDALRQRTPNPVRKLGLLLVASLAVFVFAGLVSLAPGEGFEAKNDLLLPLDYPSQFAAALLNFGFSVYAILVLLLLSDLVLFKRKRHTMRNLRAFLVLTVLTALSTITLLPLESSVLTGVLMGFAVLFAAVNAFRLSWIVYLTRREKVLTLLYSAFLFLALTTFTVMIGQSGAIERSLLYYSVPMKEVLRLSTIFGSLYAGLAFVSTLFHLPTAEALERKTVEISSLHNLGKLVTQVFDFQELVETVTAMTLQVCEARSCWLELIHPGEGRGGGFHIEVVGMKNITPAEIDDLLSTGRHTLRDDVLAERRPVVVDDLRRDPRFAHLPKGRNPVGSLIVVPLVSHAGPVGILYVTKESEYGFFKDDLDVVSAFADQATIAIENSRLIKKSIERERLLREMLLAQEMQRKLLPQTLPAFPHLDIDAHSVPAFEVGGDYYDVLRIDEHRLGVVVGDVSGKGVSAAFYMSEVKGIFQSLGRLYPSPREFLIKANEALVDSIDKHSFISLLYLVVDLSSGSLTLSRAGHCPLLHVSAGSGRYLRPSGMGLGLSRGDVFASSLGEERVTLRPGDLCVLYTDGVTEARRSDDEFGYDRLLATAVRVHDRPAPAVREEIIGSIRRHAERENYDDDVTVVVLRWNGDAARHHAQPLAEKVP